MRWLLHCPHSHEGTGCMKQVGPLAAAALMLLVASNAASNVAVARAAPEPAAITLRLSSRSPRTARVVLDSIGTRISLQLGYESVEGIGDGWAMNLSA